jgi:hypothetical protein
MPVGGRQSGTIAPVWWRSAKPFPPTRSARPMPPANAFSARVMCRKRCPSWRCCRPAAGMAFHRPAAEQQDTPDRGALCLGAWPRSAEKIAQRLSEQRPTGCRRCRSASRSMSAAKPANTASIRMRRWPGACGDAALPGLRLRGFMAIPEPSLRPEACNARVSRVAELLRRRSAPAGGGHLVDGHVGRS